MISHLLPEERQNRELKRSIFSLIRRVWELKPYGERWFPYRFNSKRYEILFESSSFKLEENGFLISIEKVTMKNIFLSSRWLHITSRQIYRWGTKEEPSLRELTEVVRLLQSFCTFLAKKARKEEKGSKEVSGKPPSGGSSQTSPSESKETSLPEDSEGSQEAETSSSESSSGVSKEIKEEDGSLSQDQAVARYDNGQGSSPPKKSPSPARRAGTTGEVQLERRGDSSIGDDSSKRKQPLFRGCFLEEKQPDGGNSHTPTACSRGEYEDFFLLPITFPKGGGGGRQLDVGCHLPSFDPSLMAALHRLLGGKDLGRKVEGYDFWWSKKVVRCILTANWTKICDSKGDRPPYNLYFIVDTSGSVSDMGEFIVSLISSAKRSPHIHVWSGSEAHPEKDEKLGERIINYKHSFAENLLLWLRHVQPERGASLVFWGDLHDIHIRGEENRVKKILSPYKTIFLHSCEKECGYKADEKKNARQAGFRILPGINNEIALIRAIQSIV